MTRFFAYAELTWPEVAELPRATPLVLPLGVGYDLPRLAEALQDPPAVGLLPPLPYGWRGSGLAVPEPPLVAILTHLAASLRDDGFTRVHVLAPQEVAVDLGVIRVAQPLAMHLVAVPPVPDAADLPKVVLIPIGHTEQHGHHLPLATDTLIVDAIAQGTVELCPELATALPAFPYGVSTHRASFAGTLNTGGRPFEDFWLAVIDVLVQRGAHRIYLVSGHGGNCSFLVNVVKYAGERHRQAFCATAWLHTAAHLGAPAIDAHRRSPVGGMGHAGELETSMLLHLRPDLVHMDRVVDEVDFIATPSYYMDWVEGGALIANPPWEDDTTTGAYGAGSLATAEHGHLWLQTAIAEKADHVAEIHQQYLRRAERRQRREDRFNR